MSIPSTPIAWNHVARKYPDVHSTSVDDLEESLLAEGHFVNRSIAVALLQEFDRLKLGSFRTGRRGHPTRINWTKKPRDLAPTFDEGHPTPPATRMTEHEVPLRPGVVARVTIPLDITDVEAGRLCEFVKFVVPVKTA